MLRHGAVADDLITLTFDQDLDETSAPPVIEQGRSPSNAITVTVDQIRVSFTAVAVDGRELRLTLASPVRAGARGQSPVSAWHGLAAARHLDAAESDRLVRSAPTDQPHACRPALSAEIVGWTLRVTFDAPSDRRTEAIGTAGFGVARRRPPTVAVNEISADGAILVLRIATPVTTGVAVNAGVRSANRKCAVRRPRERGACVRAQRWERH